MCDVDALCLPMEVLRVELVTDGRVSSTYITPPLDSKWPKQKQLCWNAGVILIDCGIELHVHEIAREPGRFSLGGKHWGMGDMSFNDCWLWMTGFHMGAEKALELKDGT